MSLIGALVQIVSRMVMWIGLIISLWQIDGYATGTVLINFLPAFNITFIEPVKKYNM